MDNSSHDAWLVLGNILLILGISGLIIPLLQRIKISSVLGYLMCGLIIGPYGLGTLTHDYNWLSTFVITDTHLIHMLAELGVAFLLFMIGLELTLSRLWELRKYVLGLGSVQIFLTGIVLFFIALQFQNTLPTAILIGAAFALSSTAIVIQMLTEWHLVSRPIGRICFSVLLMQDLAVVPILVMVGAFTQQGDGSIIGLLAEALVTACVVIAVIFVAGKLLLRPTLRALSPAKNTEWLLSVVLFLVIGSAVLTQSFGLSAALGAFLAGLLIAETEYRHQIEVIIKPVKEILMGIFFLSVGMSIDMSLVMDHTFWLPISVLGIFFLKSILFYPIARLFGISNTRAIQSAILLAQCGEFAFIVIGLASAGGLLPQDDAQFFLLVAATSMLITPFTSKIATMLNDDDESSARTVDDPLQMQNHVIIAGFGRIGQTLAMILEDQKIPYVAVDSNGTKVSQLHKNGYPIYVGNAHNIELWDHLGVDQASAVILTINDYAITKEMTKALRHKWPLLPIIVRIQDTRHIDRFFKAGATAVVPETLEPTLQLVRMLLEQTGVDPDDAQTIIQKHRREILALEEDMT